jgi:hypothetical protein
LFQKVCKLNSDIGIVSKSSLVVVKNVKTLKSKLSNKTLQNSHELEIQCKKAWSMKVGSTELVITINFAYNIQIFALF